MKKIIKAKWLKALRSGKYKKAAGTLKVEGKGFCCLGVLTDLYAKEKGIKDPWHKTKKGHSCSVKLKGEKEYCLRSLLPEKVQNWSGIKDDNPQAGANTLSGWNDGEKTYTTPDKKSEWLREPKSFKQIADLIEKHL